MKRLLWTFAMLILLMSVVVEAGRPPAPLIRVVTHPIEQAITPERLDDTIQMALLDAAWIPLDVSAGHIIAETTVEQKHYVKVDIKYDTTKVIFSLLEMGETVDEGTCYYKQDGQMFRGACVHPYYYLWLEKLMAGLPLASARVEFIRSLNSSPLGNEHGTDEAEH